MRQVETTEYKPVQTLIADQAAKFGDKPYMVSIDQGEKQLSFLNLFKLGNQMAHFFSERGLKANDRILLLAENSIEFIATFLGVQRCGGTIATANVEMNRAHVDEILRAVNPILVLVQEGLDLEKVQDKNMPVEWISLGKWNPDGNSSGFFKLLENYSSINYMEVEKVNQF